ncbi:MAG TPA: hypothetical protein VLD19_21780 [Chitinophagaceae bacterium]|nr:hypothetical protein [Chitinophagaceae bacterium]
MKSHRHILSKRAQELHMERIKGQGHQATEPETITPKSAAFAPTLLKNITDKARRRVLRAASRLNFWAKK